MKQPLTKIEKLTLDFLIEFYRKNGFMPSQRETGKKFKRCASSIFERLNGLENKGWIHKEWNRKRWIIIK